VIDLNQSTRMDTTSVEHVARSFKTVTEAGGTVVIADSREKYANIWKITTLNQIIDFCPSVEEAVAAVRQTINRSD
jgi:anti-anti-sigma regulatory factor